MLSTRQAQWKTDSLAVILNFEVMYTYFRSCHFSPPVIGTRHLEMTAKISSPDRVISRDLYSPS